MPKASKTRRKEPENLEAEQDPALTTESAPLTVLVREILRRLWVSVGSWFAWRSGPTEETGGADKQDSPVRAVADAKKDDKSDAGSNLPQVANNSGQITLRAKQGVDIARTSLGTAAKRRRASRLGFAIVVFLLLAPLITWMRYQTLHVTSTNAIIRGHVAEIGTRLEGVVVDVEVDAGDRVFAGQVLARLEDRHLEAEAIESRATLEGLRHQYDVEKLEIEHERRQIDQQMVEANANLSAAQAESNAARIRAKNARESYEIRRDLFTEGGAISGDDVRQSENSQQETKALMRASEAERIAASSAREKIRLLVDALAIRERRLKVLESEIARAEANLSKAEADLEEAFLRAPQDGAIVRRIVQAGGSVDVGQPILSMRLGDDVWVEAWIDEEDISDVRSGDKAIVSLYSFPDQEFTGTVDKLGLTTDFEMPESDVPQPRFQRMRGRPVVGVRIKLDDPPIDLLPGLSAVVAIRKSST